MKEKKVTILIIDKIIEENLSFSNLYNYHLVYSNNKLVKILNEFNTKIDFNSGVGEFINKNFNDYNENNNHAIFYCNDNCNNFANG